ncbi:hypothetical protein J4E86_003591 [Alternaria arbusti]|uniref:uncharacterized protein n=1 Tax=Alternaria arbusti TaxID=232088 RepID=UPI00221F91E1|nr:uncharacterized protein J4E86_003591 [Alternaria arbusti]KAI4959866.1 hypothetical protein J4E86_003591 [Alternaria arbusti]
MLLNAQTLALAAFFSTLATGRPLDSSKPREIVPRNKSYSVVNVGGDASTPVATATSVIETTKTVEVVGPAQTVTQELEQRVEVVIVNIHTSLVYSYANTYTNIIGQNYINS